MSLTKDDVWTALEVADLLGCSKRTVTRLAERGELPGQRFGGRWLFVKDQVEDRLRGVSGPVGEGGETSEMESAA